MNINTPLRSLQESESFIGRHIGPDDHDTHAMLSELGYGSLSDRKYLTMIQTVLLNSQRF
jgi:glycine dehydrogenase